MFKIFAVNPGSTSTKIALFEDEALVFSYSVEYDAGELNRYPTISDQLPYRMKNIREVLEREHVDLTGLSACVGRCGSVLPVEGGTYEVNDLMLEHSRVGINGVYHPAQLGGQIAGEFARQYGCPLYTVNPPAVDEFEPHTRLTGVKGILRESHLHALNLKETAIHHSRIQGTSYEACNYIVCHIGGGISVSAHRNGRMVDGNDIAKGLGPIAPTRCGTIPAAYLIEYIFQKLKERREENDGVEGAASCENESKNEFMKLCTRTGGVVDLLGTSDMKEVYRKAMDGSEKEALVWNAMVYSICKEIGAMAAVLEGQIDGILLSGGLVFNEDLVAQIRRRCGFLAPVYAYPGEFEMEAMANGVLRVLRGEEQAKVYTGVPVFDASKSLI